MGTFHKLLAAANAASFELGGSWRAFLTPFSGRTNLPKKLDELYIVKVGYILFIRQVQKIPFC